jgi:uncharacterized RDD family membrane protein YckC
MKWFYIDESVTDGDRRKGPYNIDEIFEFVKEGLITEKTLVWHSGMENWATWEEMDESKAPETLSEEEQIKQALEAILAEHNKGKRYAGFLVRALAYLTDGVILSAIGVLLMLAFFALHLVDVDTFTAAITEVINNPTSEEAATKFADIPGMHLFFIVYAVIQAAYFVVFNTLKSATPGKMLLKIHIETANGEKLNWVTAALRYVASLITQCTIMFYGLGYLIVLIDPKRRALHDHIARTRVVYNKRQAVVSNLQPKDESKS